LAEKSGNDQAMAEPKFIEHTSLYPFASALTLEGRRGRLVLATSGKPIADRLFFAGALRRPEAAALLLLATSEVALRRFYIPPGMLARILRAADPVVTASSDRLRFEALSQCGGVYARADMLPGMLIAETCGKGTTNVDFNPPMRAALAKVRDDDGLDLRVGPDAVAIGSARGTAIEHKVELPIRWLRGFAEVQALAATLEPVITLSAPAARRFLAAIPPKVSAKDRTWLLPAGEGVRMSRQPSAAGVATAGLGRLRAMRPLARHADRLRIYAGANGTSAFELDLGAARFTLLLSAAPSRGFSGEGQLLSRLSRPDCDKALARVRAQLAWQSTIETSAWARRFGLDETEVSTALSLLATQGLVGFDAHERRYFHRELPFDRSKIEDLHPRLNGARALIADGAVTIERLAAETGRATVQSADVVHRVRVDGDTFHCTCLWHARTGGESGPCKHVLAAMLAINGQAP
jgi:hypothetical protein